MNYIDLFHGIGGFPLGAYWAGMKFDNHFCSDIEPYTQELYKLRFPDSIQLGDITKIDTNELKKYGSDWIITGGVPCQDISIAGKGVGIHGKRSGLWFEYLRLINDLRPRFAIMENVGMLIHRGLREVLGSLAEIGYNAEWQDIRAEDVGAPHKRERIWIVAYPGHLPGGDKEQGILRTLQKDRAVCNKITGSSKTRNEIPDTNRLNDDDSGHGASAVCRERSEASEIQRCFSDTAIEGLEREKPERWTREHNGLSSECNTGNWKTEPAVGRLVNGLPGRVDRLKCLGNSIVPQIAELLFNQIKEHI